MEDSVRFGYDPSLSDHKSLTLCHTTGENLRWLSLVTETQSIVLLSSLKAVATVHTCKLSNNIGTSYARDAAQPMPRIDEAGCASH